MGVADTTDVQIAEVMYFRNRLFLNCSFADNSRARGCAVRLTLAETNDTEIYRFLLDDSVLPCFETDFRLDAGAYNELVVIVDIEEDDMLGSGNLTVVPMNVSTEDVYTGMTGCPIGINNCSPPPLCALYNITWKFLLGANFCQLFHLPKNLSH